jgi:hypothetical protein
MKAEGTFEYEALLFLPSHAPFDLYTHETPSAACTCTSTACSSWTSATR